MKQRILVVDDDEEIVELVKSTLNRAEFAVDCSYTGREATKKVQAIKPDLIILDLGLPDISGWEVCRALKKHARTKFIPILIITGEYTETNDISRGLTSGADDYVTKPFDPDILLARVKAILRRVRYQGIPEETLKCKNITLNLTGHTLLVGNKPVKITPKEFALMYFLMKNKGRSISKKELMENIWEQDYGIFSSETIKKHIQTLRRKIGSPANKSIVTVEGMGYKIA